MRAPSASRAPAELAWSRLLVGVSLGVLTGFFAAVYAYPPARSYAQPSSAVASAEVAPALTSAELAELCGGSQRPLEVAKACPSCPVCRCEGLQKQECAPCPETRVTAALAAADPDAFPTMGEPQTNVQRDLLAVLQRITTDRKEVLVAVSDHNLLNHWTGAPGMLQLWVQGVKRSGVKNFLVAALDEQLARWCRDNDVPYYLRKVEIPKVQAGTGSNHATSALKFWILQDFVQLGYNVFLSDVDVVVLKNPFDHLARDADVEGMSDGFDPRTAYGEIQGHDDPSMGWSRYAQKIQHFVFNSGLFYLRANRRTLDLLQRIEKKLAIQRAWDQSVFNEFLFLLPHDDVSSPMCSKRVLGIDSFCNSKRLFKYLRQERDHTTPVMVHVNYHPDKYERMVAIIKRYVDGDRKALDPFPGGSEPGS